MVLDYLVSPEQAKRDPASLTIAAILFVTFAVLLEIFVPAIKASIIIFSMVPAIPLLWSLMVREEMSEEKEFENAEKMWREAFGKNGPIRRIISSHENLITVFAFFFVGAVIAYTAWFTLLPSLESSGYVAKGTSARIFVDQMKELEIIRGSFAQVSGHAILPVVNEKQLWFIFFHNLQVLVLMMLFSLVYGIGSIYLLLWNASIIGSAVGMKAVTAIANGKILKLALDGSTIAQMQLPPGIAAGIVGGIEGIIGLLAHGIFEVGAYFIATIAGAILSFSVMRSINKPEFKYFLADVAVLLGAAIVILFIGAVIEAS